MLGLTSRMSEPSQVADSLLAISHECKNKGSRKEIILRRFDAIREEKDKMMIMLP